MSMDFSGKTAIVTGAALGIGRETARLLAARGALVVVADINQAEGRATVEQIEAAGGAAHFIACDVGSEEQISALVAEAARLGGGLDAMINNAGIGGKPGPLHTVETADWRRVLEIDLTSVFWGQKYATKAMLERGTGGAIVNVSSIAGIGGAAMLGAYAVAKAGVIQLTQTGALEVAKAGVRINAVCPGWTDTAILDTLGPDARQTVMRQVPMQRLGRPAEVAELIVFLASDAASFITGASYRIDGGQKS